MDELAELVIVPDVQPVQFCRVTVLAESVTLTLPLVACSVNPLALTDAAVPVVPIEPLSLARTTEVALPVAPLIPEPEVTMEPLPVVDSRKNVPVLLTVDE